MNNTLIVPYTNGQIFIDLENKMLLLNGKSIKNQDTYDLSKYWSSEATAITIETIAYITVRKIDFPHKHYHLLNAVTDTGELTFEDLYLVNGPVESTRKGYFYIWGYEGFVITKNGKVKHNFSGRDVPVILAETGRIKRVKYNRVTLAINPFTRSNTVGRYRALALAFLIPPSNPAKLDVNHIDGNSENDDISNLEWNTRQQNAYHAYSTGLRDDNKPVLVKNIETGEITEHFSIGETARIYNSDPATIYHRCNNELRVYEGKYLFKYKTDKTPWPTKEEELRLLNAQATPPVMAYDVLDGSLTLYKSAQEASIACRGKLSPTTISKRCRDENIDKPVNGYQFYRPHLVPEKLPTYTPLQLDYIKYCLDNECEVKIGWFMTNLNTGETKIGNNGKDIKEFTGRWPYAFDKDGFESSGSFRIEKIFT